MNPNLRKLQPYPFEKLAKLKAGITPPQSLEHIALSIGEPKHPAPAFVKQAFADHMDGFSGYPLTKGSVELRQSIARWIERRFAARTDVETQIIPVNGTREALFAFAQAIIDPTPDALVISPNPFYQIYEGAAFLSGAEPWFMNTTADTGYLPDFSAVPESVWQRCQLIYVCSPGNPTGAVIPEAQLLQLIELADKYDFVIASDECYSELYPDEANPPLGLLQVCAKIGRNDFKRCVVFHSLSKRSNLPGMRSGFVAGDTDVLAQFLRYRTYHGCAMPPPAQIASTVAWNDETHVLENRELYRIKFDAVLKILSPVMDVKQPDAGFYLWAKTTIDDTLFTQQLFAQQNVTVLPGSYLSREAHGINPGANHVRMALVATLDECVTAAKRIRQFIESL
ncbi:MAG: succinyldiaminopimelate transaminase [Gammaproteobacteria bacterium]|nr:succinyldiaminopimelate transaminase [Gammaproteobacteria bacterium]